MHSEYSTALSEPVPDAPDPAAAVASSPSEEPPPHPATTSTETAITAGSGPARHLIRLVFIRLGLLGVAEREAAVLRTGP
jgi:hypothetical protein